MFIFLKKALFWLLWRLTWGVLLAALGLGVYAWWLDKQDTMEFPARRAAVVAELVAERATLVDGRAALEQQLAALEDDLRAQHEAVESAVRAIEVHRSLESTWKRWTGDSAQQELNDRRREEQEQKRMEAEKKIIELKESLARVTWKHEGNELAIAQLERRIQLTETESSKHVHYARIAWDAGRWYALAFVGVFMVWPALRRTLLFYVVAPFVVRRKPLRLAGKTEEMPALGKAGESVQVDLWPGEMLRVKKNFIESADSGLVPRARFWLNVRFPITNIACGLVRLVEMRNTHAGHVSRVFLDGEGSAHAELTEVALPEDSSLVLRPRYLAGVVQHINTPLVIRSHWRIFSWHAWVTGQFRFLEFVGPCRLVVASRRGVQAETLEPREDGRRPVRRANDWATIGFTPNLRYRPARAESFWSYCRGMSALYDDLFIGTGLFFVQKTAPGAARSDKGRVRQFVAARWRGFQKIFGM